MSEEKHMIEQDGQPRHVGPASLEELLGIQTNGTRSTEQTGTNVPARLEAMGLHHVIVPSGCVKCAVMNPRYMAHA